LPRATQVAAVGPDEELTAIPRGTAMTGSVSGGRTRTRATELLERPARAVVDFALTEVVHCKSVDEVGVDDAYDTCVEQWLRPVVRAAGARVIVLFGVYAGKAFHDFFGVPPRAPFDRPAPARGERTDGRPASPPERLRPAPRLLATHCGAATAGPAIPPVSMTAHLVGSRVCAI